MKTTVITRINYPEEFLIACGIHRLRPEEFLQQFVNRFHYSGLLCEAEDDTEYAVNQAVLDCIKTAVKVKNIPKAGLALCRKWILKLKVIFDENKALSERQLRTNISYTLLACKKELGKKQGHASSVCLPDGCNIYLPNNFIVMCSLFGISAEAVLQHLLNHISLAKETAFNQFDVAAFDPYMDFFHAMAKQFFKDSKELREIGFNEYDRQVVELYEKMKREESYEKRLAAFTKQYKKWYEAVKGLPIKATA